MVEVVGAIASAVTLAGLFKLCIEVFDIVRTSKNQGIDLQKLNLKLNIEKCRLWTWGQAMGLTQNPAPDSPQPLDQCQFISVVEESLGFILALFNDSQALSTKYGCRKLLQDNESVPPQGVYSWANTVFESVVRQFQSQKLEQIEAGQICTKELLGRTRQQKVCTSHIRGESPHRWTPGYY